MKARYRGFTLIEIVMVVAILSLFFGFGLKLYSDFNAKKILEEEVRQFVEQLRLAKKKATSGDKDGIAVPCTLSGYRVVYADSTYELYAQCPDLAPVGVPVVLADGVMFAASGAVTFRPLGLTTAANCIIVQNQAGRCRLITVTESGTVSFSDETVSCSCN